MPEKTALEALLAYLLHSQKTRTVAFVNAHAVNLAWDRAEVAEAFLATDILVRDGKGLEMLYARLGMPAGLNMNGTDLIPNLLERAKGKSIAVLGTKDPWLARAVQRLREDGHRITMTLDGFEEDDVYVERIAQNRPDIVLLAMGMPKQERVAAAIKTALPNDGPFIICGGAIVDFIAGRYPRAPVWMRQAGLEWFYRLCKEPVRLFNRYVIGNLKFLYRTRQITSLSPKQEAS